jgi:hypothetical protein
MNAKFVIRIKINPPGLKFPINRVRIRKIVVAMAMK